MPRKLAIARQVSEVRPALNLLVGDGASELSDGDLAKRIRELLDLANFAILDGAKIVAVVSTPRRTELAGPIKSRRAEFEAAFLDLLSRAHAKA